jgi:tetratricopeptide (TPR) repeat protein
MSVAVTDRGAYEYHALLATILIQEGDYPSALEPTREALRLNPDDAESWLRLGALYLRLKRGGHAINTYRTASARFADRPEFLIGRGVVEEMLAKLPAAIAIYREVTHIFPHYEQGYWFLGQALIKAVLPDEARATGRRLLALNPQSAYGHYLLAQADWITPGGGQEAREHLVRALELDPRFAEAAILAGKVELRAGDPAKAIDFLRRAVEIDPQLEEAYFLLARAYRQSGDNKQAEIELAHFRRLRRPKEQENRLLSNFLASGAPRP